MPDSDDRWWDAWPTAWTTDEEIAAIVGEEADEIASELLTHLRDTRLAEARKPLEVGDDEQEDTHT